QLTRGGTQASRLNAAQIKLIPRQTDPDRSVYDGSYSAEIVLDDVRVGDVIEFAYSTEGANPLRRGKYSAGHSMQWGVPIARNVLRLIYRADRTLSFQGRNGACQPIIKTVGAMTEAWCDVVHVPGRKIEDDVPD